ncbi:PP2C family protein-serine/threonine phosphatase [Kitasatospora cineracea]|uniref:Serine phosphatase RsbU (Regulator of sigma subunit) n=1 Tax=Kitasatospora cineracea TaxID=88074 RepID=A0A3N4RZ03_9ACTN|nr:PP2C family protein-serine/threonine phosphatase [Kitasatospora cineracea]ROR43355.1 serine phosphatase RsbU (regulator of sigma subunit) [Kitasatospora cineracea]RPE33727.1 serine phosphatase RsbU (regulator of sigma subunit) [Kitasatospora cineracea]
MTDVHPLTSTAPAATALPPAPAAPAADPLLLPELGEVPAADLQDRLAGWLSDFTSLQEHLELLARADGLAGTLDALLDSGAALLGARRGLVVTLPPGSEGQPARPVGLGLDRATLGTLETVPVEHGPFAGLLGRPGPEGRLLIADLAADPAVGPRFREVAEQLGLGACYALPLATGPAEEVLGAAAWFYDEPGSPDERREHLVRRYCEFAAPLLARQLAADRAVRAAETLRRSLLPGHLPARTGLKVAARCVPAALERAAGSDWYDAIALPDDTVGLTVGSVLGGGPGAGPHAGTDAAAAMGRVRAALRAYAVLEGEDPVSVLGDLELLLKTTEPTRSATAVYACVDPAGRRIALAGAANCPPVLLTRYGANFVETSLSAPLGMLSCWEAPGVELTAEPGDVLVLYTEGLARRFAPALHAGQSALRRAAADAPRDVRLDPDRLCAHLLEQAGGGEPGTDDLVLLAARFE